MQKRQRAHRVHSSDRSANRQHPQSQSNQVSNFQPQSVEKAHPVIAMQRMIGNSATRRHLQRAPLPTVSYNSNIDRGTRSAATGNAAITEILDSLVELAKQTVADWIEFRDHNYEAATDTLKVDQPAKALGIAAFDAKKRLTKLQNDIERGGIGSEDEDRWAMPGAPGILAIAHSDDARIDFTTYLQNRLDSEQLTALREALSFSTAAHMATVRSLFGLEPLHIEHNYEMKLREAKNWVKRPHEAIISYSNNIGMRYTKEISFRWLGGGANLFGELKKKVMKEAKNQVEGVIEEEIETAFGADPNFSETTVSKPDANQFWLPTWFEEATISQFAAFGKADYSHALAKDLAKAYEGVHVMTFNYKAFALTFDLSSDLFEMDPSLPDKRIATARDIYEKAKEAYEGDIDFDPDADIDEYNADDLKKGRSKLPSLVTGEIGTDWDIMFKYGYNVKGKAPIKEADKLEIDFGIRNPVDPGIPDWQPLVSAEIYFDTGDATPSPEAEEAISQALVQVRNYLAKDPQAALRFVVLGKASKVWKALRKGETAAERNMELSKLRAETTLSTLQMLREGILEGILPGVIEDQMKTDSEGAQYEDIAEPLGSENEAYWQDDLTYKIAKSKKRSRKASTDNTPTERGASIRIAVRPTPEEQVDPDAALKERLAAPSPETVGEMAMKQALIIMGRLLGIESE